MMAIATIMLKRCDRLRLSPNDHNSFEFSGLKPIIVLSTIMSAPQSPVQTRRRGIKPTALRDLPTPVKASPKAELKVNSKARRVLSFADDAENGNCAKENDIKTEQRKQVPVLPLRRTLIRSSSKKCWEATSPLVGYQRWRKMQYSMNWRMMIILRGLAKMSLLRLTDPASTLKGKTVVEIADGDPNPDADVKFMEDGSHRLAPDSILHSYDAKDTVPSCILLGCPGHISIGILWPHKGKRKAFIEHFDSRGINESIQAGGGSFLFLPNMRTFFKNQFGIDKLKTVNNVDFQEVELDVYCQTWIFYFVYMRLIHKHSAARIRTCIDMLTATQKLDEIKRFQHWLLEGVEFSGYCPGVQEPQSTEDCRHIDVLDSRSSRKSFKLPYKPAPSHLRRLSLSPVSAAILLKQSNTGTRTLRKSTRQRRQYGAWRLKRGQWRYQRPGSKTTSKYTEISWEGGPDVKLAEILLEPGLRLCIQLDNDSTWRLVPLATGSKGVGGLKKLVVGKPADSVNGNESPHEDKKVPTTKSGVVCAFALGRKRITIDFSSQQLGYKHGCVLLRPQS